MQASTSESPCLTAALADLVSRRPVAEADLRGAALFTLDAVANIVGGARAKEARPAFAWGCAEPLTIGRRAFLYGVGATVLEMDAMHRQSSVHAGTVVVPAVLALEGSARGDGRRQLEAILRGSEAAFRIGRAAGSAHYRIYQNTATIGRFGAAMAAALLLGLDRAQTVHALGNAGTLAGGLWEYRETGAMTKQLHAGGAAEAGIAAAQLAARGVTGPMKILEGDRGFFKAACPDADPGAVLRDPEGPWGLHACSIKPWPSSRHTHPAIDAALGIALPAGSAIEAVEVETYRAAVDLCGKRSPGSPHQGKSSIAYCVAAALADGRVDLASFEAEAFERHRALLPRIDVKADENLTRAYPQSWGARVAVRLADGQRIDCARIAAKGDPESPLSDGEFRDKARSLLLLGGVADPEKAIARLLAAADGRPLPAFTITPEGLAADWD